MKAFLKKIVNLVFLLFYITTLSSQVGFGEIGYSAILDTDPFYCPDSVFQQLLNEAASKAQSCEYDLALKKCYSAKVCNEGRENEVNEQIDRIFKMIIAEKDLTQAALERLDTLNKKNEKLINAIYFYKDSFGLAYDSKIGKFGFMDKNLNVKINFIFEDALPFDSTGFARGKINGKNFLVATNADKFSLAIDIEQLTQDSNIVAIDLRNKKLKNLPYDIFRHTHLKILLISHNQIENLNLIGFKRIEKYMNISMESKISNMTRSFGSYFNLKNLEIFDISFNKLYKLNRKIKKLQGLKKFNLSNNNLEIIPVEIGELYNLVELNLKNNNLTKLPLEISNLKNLKRLDLRGNPMTKIEQEKILLLLPGCEILF